MKKYKSISEEDLVEKILRSQSMKDMGFRLRYSKEQSEFNKFWGIDIQELISVFNDIQRRVEYLDYMNEDLVCDFCGKHFTRKERLVINKSGRHFCSDLCGKRFSSSFSHTEEKKYELSLTMKSLSYDKLMERVGIYNLNPKVCPICKNLIPYERRQRKTCSLECGRKLNALNNHKTQSIRHSSGGKRHGSGRGKKGWYKGFWCDSSWELAVVIYWLEHDVQFNRNLISFPYQFNGKKRRYYPDFIVSDGTFVEVKGYSSKQWNAKVNQFPKDKKLQVIGKLEIRPYLDYAISKYGKQFTNLYENGSVV